jgi:multidrug efflux pump subunit AcrA (membrane-fusion protein)
MAPDQEQAVVDPVGAPSDVPLDGDDGTDDLRDSDGHSDGDDTAGGADGDRPHRRRGSAGSRRRRRQAALVVGVAVASAAGGIAIGSQLKSPADAASERAAPAPSLITVPVEMRQLVSTLILTGETRYVEPTPVRLAGAVGASGGERQVVTRMPDVDTEVTEGAVLFEISGRPVFAMRGDLPMYRQLAPGSTGPDVLQLETSLQTLGFAPGTVDETFDAGTEAALDAFYQSQGYVSEGASDGQRQQLTEARKAVVTAEDNLRKANIDLDRGQTSVTPSQLLQAQQAVEQAQDAVPETQTKAQRADDQAAAATATAIALRDQARAARDAQKVIYDAAAAAGAINPETGEAYTPAELAVVQQELISKEQALIEAEQEASRAASEQQFTAESGADEVARAQDSLALARAQLNDLQKPADTTSLRDAVAAADQQVADAQAALAALEAEIGTIVPAGEVVFLPTLPTTITTLNAQLGAQPPADAIAQVSSTDTEIIGRVSNADAELITVGTPVTIELRDVGIETTGALTDVRTPSSTPDPNNPNGGFGGGGGDDSGRLEVVVVADDTTQIREFIGFPVRISVTVSATDDEVLAVPVAAISVGPDGTSRVEVERERARGTRAGVTEVVEVTVGLAAQGYAEITPVGGSIEVGDRVVVGTDTGERTSRRERASQRAASDDSAEASG